MNVQPIDYAQAQAGYHTNAEARRTAREDLLKHLKERAMAEHNYRKALSIALTKRRLGGMGAGEAEVHARGDAAQHALERDVAEAEAKAAQARLAELEAERASLRQLADWSMREGVT